jgi:hypothetical protein
MEDFSLEALSDFPIGRINGKEAKGGKDSIKRRLFDTWICQSVFPDKTRTCFKTTKRTIFTAKAPRR